MVYTVHTCGTWAWCPRPCPAPSHPKSWQENYLLGHRNLERQLEQCTRLRHCINELLAGGNWPTAHTVSGLLFTIYSCWQWRYEQIWNIFWIIIFHSSIGRCSMKAPRCWKMCKGYLSHRRCLVKRDKVWLISRQVSRLCQINTTGRRKIFEGIRISILYFTIIRRVLNMRKMLNREKKNLNG